MMQDKDFVMVRDLGSTNGIRINGQRVEEGKLRPGDELSIAHIRFRMEPGQGEELTLAETMPADHGLPSSRASTPSAIPSAPAPAPSSENPLAAAVRELLPAAMADRCRIQVIVQMPQDESVVAGSGRPDLDSNPGPDSDSDAEAQTPDSDRPCPPDSSLSPRD